ncbi:MAG: ATP-dependent protease ATPase subunit HslU, partial [Spirochaetia bacterium]|nr:ATP-dependent protease ATPase subunit HslU [Spirochaetia bacterium]
MTDNIQKEKLDLDHLTPAEIVSELDKYIVGQKLAKRAVAIAMRNRIRRRLVPDEMKEEIFPKNIIMIGPTGCGKTEIARRISKLIGAPFIKVEATKYTEVGYVGRDVESMVRDLSGISVNMVKKEFRDENMEKAKETVEERLLDLLLPGEEKKKEREESSFPGSFAGFDMSSLGKSVQAGMEKENEIQDSSHAEETERKERVRGIFREKLRSGEMEDKEVELDIQSHASPMVQVLSGHNMEDIDMQVQNMLGDFMPKKSKKRRVSIDEARKILLEEELDRMLDQDKIQSEAIRRVEQMGIIFIDEIDKVCGKGNSQTSGADVSREGVQRDLLPIVEGATVNTRNGPVKTDH